MADLDELRAETATGVGRRLASKNVDAVDVTEYFLANIAAHDDPNVFLTVTAKRARAEASANRCSITGSSLC